MAAVTKSPRWGGSTVRTQTQLGSRAREKGKEWRGGVDGIGQRAAVLIDPAHADGCDEVVLENCKFINCFRGVETRGGNRIRLINCEYIFERSLANPPAVTTCQYGYYLAGGKDIWLQNCYAYGSRLDGYKTAIGTSHVKLDGCTSDHCGVSPDEEALYGVTHQEGSGVDLAFSANVIRVNSHTVRDTWGVAYVTKSHQDFNPTYTDPVTGRVYQNENHDIEFNSCHAEDVQYGITHEGVDPLDFPTPPSNPGLDRPQATRVRWNGGTILRAVIGGLLNGPHFKMQGAQIVDCEREGLQLYVHCRDNEFSDVTIKSCRRDNGIWPGAGLTITGARGVQWSGGLIDGLGDDGITYHRGPIEIFDYDGSNTCADLFFQPAPVMRNWIATGSPKITCFSSPAVAIFDQVGAFNPNTAGGPGAEGAMGGKASIFRRTDTGDVYRSTGAANTRGPWTAM